MPLYYTEDNSGNKPYPDDASGKMNPQVLVKCCSWLIYIIYIQGGNILFCHYYFTGPAFQTSSLPLWLADFKMLNLQSGQVALICSHLSMQGQ